MRILTRYVLFDLLKVFLLTLTGLTLLIFIVLIGKEAVDKGIGLGPLLRMAPYLIPQAMQFAVPGTMLLATTSVYGRMASYNEIVAIKALGISPMVLVWPTLILATLVSFVAVVVNDVAVSWGTMGVRRVFLASIEEVTYSQLKMRHTYNLGKANITVRDVDGHRLISPTLIMQSSGDKPSWTISAEEAELQLKPDEGKLVATFHKFELEGSDHLQRSGHIRIRDVGRRFDRLDAKEPQPFDLRTGRNHAGDQGARANARPHQAEQYRASRVRHADGRFRFAFERSLEATRRTSTRPKTRLYRLHTEPWRRWANGFSCLCFVLIGIPVAIRMRFSEFIASFFICFLPILVVYYPLLAVSVDKAKDGFFPPQSVWLGNIVLATAGIWLLRRVNRH